MVTVFWIVVKLDCPPTARIQHLTTFLPTLHECPKEKNHALLRRNANGVHLRKSVLAEYSVTAFKKRKEKTRKSTHSWAGLTCITWIICITHCVYLYFVLLSEWEYFCLLSQYYDRPENLGIRVALLPGIFLARPEFFWAYNRKNLSGQTVWIFQIISYYPDGFKTIQIFPDYFPFSRQCQKCPDLSRSFPIFWTV